jgi:hypothetical protein
MNRNKIKLYNTDKYQAVLPAPDIDELTGDAEEVIISADGSEESASDETIGSVTFNASGGIWYDTGGPVISYTTFTAIQGINKTTILQIDKNKVEACSIKVKIKSGSSLAMYELNVIHNLATVNLHTTSTANIGSLAPAFTSNIIGNYINIECESVPTGSTFAGYVNSYII